MKKAVVVGASVIAVAAFVIWNKPPKESAIVQNVTVPQLTTMAAEGKTAFDETCAACHGANGVGTGNGPPLVHVIYEPNHHADGSFFRAIEVGVRAHHWRFGNMPPQPEVSDQEASNIVAYVRELQRANGIH